MTQQLSISEINYAAARFRWWEWDTLKIAQELCVPESLIYNALARRREDERKRKRVAA
jgi:hypothetical protein